MILVIYAFWGKQTDRVEIEGVKEAASLEEFVKTQTNLMSKEKAKALGIGNKEVSIPVKADLPNLKITLVPELMVGGDVVYKAIGEYDGKFFILNREEWKKVFSVEKKEDAIKYVDFLLAKIGEKTYDRIKQTVFVKGDYEKIGCRVMPDEENSPLPVERPTSAVDETENGFEVTWIYFTAGFPAGYYKERYLVDKEGDLRVLEKNEKPFWPCGNGILF